MNVYTAILVIALLRTPSEGFVGRFIKCYDRKFKETLLSCANPWGIMIPAYQDAMSSGCSYPVSYEVLVSCLYSAYSICLGTNSDLFPVNDRQAFDAYCKKLNGDDEKCARKKSAQCVNKTRSNYYNISSPTADDACLLIDKFIECDFSTACPKAKDYAAYSEMLLPPACKTRTALLRSGAAPFFPNRLCICLTMLLLVAALLLDIDTQ